MENDSIYHYGTPGMKWGVRKSGKSSARKQYRQAKKQNPSAQKAYNKQIKQRKKTKYTDIQNMSTKDLQERVNRMNLERQYSTLLKTQKKVVATGKQKVDNSFSKATKDVAVGAFKKGLKKSIPI